MQLRHLVGSIESDTHTALRYIAVHEWLEEVFLSFRFNARTIVFYLEKEFLVFQGEFHLDGAIVWGVFHGVAQQIIHDGFHLVVVKVHLVVAAPWCHQHVDAFLLCHLSHIAEDVFDEYHDVALFHGELHVARVRLAEFHQLVDEPLHPSGASGQGEQGVS